MVTLKVIERLSRNISVLTQTYEGIIHLVTSEGPIPGSPRLKFQLLGGRQRRGHEQPPLLSAFSSARNLRGLIRRTAPFKLAPLRAEAGIRRVRVSVEIDKCVAASRARPLTAPLADARRAFTDDAVCAQPFTSLANHSK
jgi:hypothetical protein